MKQSFFKRKKYSKKNNYLKALFTPTTLGNLFKNAYKILNHFDINSSRLVLILSIADFFNYNSSNSNSGI
ncbi:hypothetical protein BpHYR1_029488 [Brachionus plicatilis]|uniref:Uncharacterized protein n=1 Tax=Brachionus plicatilis TaxID=10195 RepID=A0A3M7S267_BRAPC|nr:hypothetical protein BpHYR1_029488 [Brachionus plicatilis]